MSQVVELKRSQELPGDFAMWCFILAELLVFAMILCSLAWARSQWPDMFAAGSAGLDRMAGLTNTLVLLSGSYAAARGIAGGTGRSVSVGFALAAGSGLLYTVVKCAEYVHMYGAGLTLRTDTFHFFYFFGTAFHLMHVLLGMVMLLVVALRARREARLDDQRRRSADAVAAYWHMVDLVWLILFPQLYLFS
jgi:nitric oxide reductase NorE protein